MGMEEEIKQYFEKLEPSKLGMKKKIHVYSVEKLGMGKNNINFIVVANKRKFLFRFNILLSSKNKSRAEFNSLELVEKLNISPKVWVLDDSRKVFDSDFIILDYLEGKSLDNVRYKFRRKFIREIVNLCIKFHLMPLNKQLLKLPRDEVSYQDLMRETNRKLKFVIENSKNNILSEALLNGYNILEKLILYNKPQFPIVLSHGDICEQNIILTKGKMRLIDFESLGLTDSASEIAYILTQFNSKGMDEKSREIFLEEYLKIIDDKTLRERVQIYIPLKNFADLLWAIKHVMKIKQNKLHKHYLENNDVVEDIKYAGKVFRRVLKDGTIDKKYSKTNLKRILR